MTSRLSSAVRSCRLRATACLTIALGFVAGSSIAQNASNEFWQAQSIYQIITDRFFDGDPSNNNADGNYNPASSGSVHGGDFKGIEQKLDYIKALGATAIWISPVVLNGARPISRLRRARLLQGGSALGHAWPTCST